MMVIKRFKLFVASDIKKEEEWLNKMSLSGLHFTKYQFPFYYFQKSIDDSYLYQVDFRDADEDYFQFLDDAGWEYVYSYINKFHYFRTNKANVGIKKIYSDHESIKETYQRMMAFYLLIFGLLVISQIGLALTWQGLLFQKIIVGLLIPVAILYIYLFISLKLKINYYRKKKKYLN